jgi:type I restriction enzyme S subunit
MEKYQSYKPSGVEWIGEIPSDWTTKKIKQFSKVFNGSTPKENQEFWDGDIVWITPSDIGKIKEQVYIEDSSRKITLSGLKSCGCNINPPFSVLLTCRGPIGNVIIPTKEFTTNQGCKTLVPENFNYKLLFYQLKCFSTILDSLGQGTTFKELSTTSLKEFKLPIPSEMEQYQIVQFLDEKTELIDRLITTKERKLSLLKEQRTSLINQIVTKGLNSNVKFKDSGVEWIGEIPENWKVGKLKHHSELNISSVDKHIFDDEISVRVCNYTDVYYNEFISNSLELRIGSCTKIEFNKFLLKKGDVIITKDSESPSDIGVPSLVIDELENIVCGYHLSIIKSNLDSLIGEYLFRQLQTTRVRRYFEVNSNGITRFGLGKSSVLELPLILPPVKEQKEIINHLNSKTKEIDDLIQLEQKKIDLLKEYRQSLISEVVTGKVKVTK